jgi:lactoylglutathione lyase
MSRAEMHRRTRITDVGSVAVPVTDQDRATRFYVDVLGFEVWLDVATEQGGRFILVAPSNGSVALALVARATTGIDTGVTFSSGDARADHTTLAARGADVDELLRWPGVPPMFIVRDSEGNQLKVMETADVGATRTPA